MARTRMKSALVALALIVAALGTYMIINNGVRAESPDPASQGSFRVEAAERTLPPAPVARAQGQRAPVSLVLDGVALKGRPGKSDTLSWHLAQLAQASREAQAQGQAITGRTPSLLPKNLRDLLAAGLMRINEGGEVQVYVGTRDPASAAAQATLALGGRIEREDTEVGILQAWLPIPNLDELAAVQAVRFVRLPDYGFVLSGSVTTEGDSILNADDVRSSLGVDGTGVKVGVVSTGLEGLSDSQASGDLPTVNYATCNVVPEDPTSPGADGEGTAMLEIVHDLAPGAELWFGHFGFSFSGTALDFNAAVNCLAQNVDVVIDDIGFFNNGPYDGTSPVSQNTADALNHVGWPIRGYFNAVGNQADGHYQEAYVDSGWFVGDPDEDFWVLHRFRATTNTTDGGQGLACEPGVYCGDTVRVQPDGLFAVFLQWNDPFDNSSNDYDLLLLDDFDDTIYLASGNTQTGPGSDPAEAFPFQNTHEVTTDFHILIGNYRNTAAVRTFDMFILCFGCVSIGGNTHNFNTISSSVSNNSDAGGSPVPIMSLGAIDQADPGHNDIEYFSSRGPTNDARTKPDASAIDGVCVTGAGGFGQGSCQTTGDRFFGTSAAAPHAGGIAALLLQCDPSLDRAGLRDALLSPAVDLGDSGPDNTFGAGRLDALAAAEGLNCGADVTVTKTADPDAAASGATVVYTLEVSNQGGTPAENVVLTDDLTVPGVTFVDSTPGAPTCSEASGVLTCDLGTVEGGASTTVTVTVTAPSTESDTNITNTAVVSSTNEKTGAGGDNSGQVITLVGPDTDLDLVPDSADNCPDDPNPGQENTDAAPIDNGPDVAGDDETVPNGDALGDVCDDDDDNDGLPDAEDTNPLGETGICAAFLDANDLHPNPAGGDVTNDDDHDGSPAPPMGTDADDNGPSWDTDNDGVRDGIECLLGHDPRNVSDRPSTAECGGSGDSDGDGLLDSWEVCKWGTSGSETDTDGDGLGDCTEVMDIDGDGSFTFSRDLIGLANAFFLPDFGQTVDMDIDGDGSITFSRDLVTFAKKFFGVESCV